MRKWRQYVPIFLLCVCMVTVLLFCLDHQIRSNLIDGIVFEDTATGQAYVPVFNEDTQKYFVFLPGYTSIESIKCSPPPLKHVTFDWDTNAGMPSTFPLGEDVVISVSLLGYEETSVFQFWQCGSIPALHIEAQPNVLTYLHESQDNRAEVMATFYGPNQEVLLDAVAQMYGRGNTTWWVEGKKPYNLKFSDPVSVGPFHNISKLSLLAEYNDKSKMHNAMVFYAGRQLEVPYSSEYMYVDLFVNGAYLGIYGVATKDTYQNYVQEDGIKAVFSITSGWEHTGVWPKLWRNPVQVLYGDAAQTLDTIANLEQALENRDWDNCGQYMDQDSFVKKYVLEEFFANTDAGYASQYFYIDQDDVIHCMLPWDYDQSMGNTFFFYNNKIEYEVKAYLDAPNWYSVLLENSSFRTACANTLTTMLSEPFYSDLREFLQNTSEQIEPSWNCDIARWGHKYLLGSEDYPLLAYPARFTNTLEARGKHLMDFFQNREDYSIVSFTALGDWNANLCIPTGEPLSDYLKDAIILSRSSKEKSWQTSEGLSPEEIDIVTQDITFTLAGHTKKVDE